MCTRAELRWLGRYVLSSQLGARAGLICGHCPCSSHTTQEEALIKNGWPTACKALLISTSFVFWGVCWGESGEGAACVFVCVCVSVRMIVSCCCVCPLLVISVCSPFLSSSLWKLHSLKVTLNLCHLPLLSLSCHPPDWTHTSNGFSCI